MKNKQKKTIRSNEEILVLVVNNNVYPDRFECVVKQKK
jgi:hypothetical protein